VTANVIPNVPEQFPWQRLFDLPNVPNPLAGVWWATQSISDVPENIMGWLVAQGYEVTAVSQDNTTVPPTNYFNVRKDGLLRRPLLTDLCNNYTIAANTARFANQVRYNDIVQNWTQMIATTHDQFDAQVEEQNLQSGVYLSDLDTYMDEINALIQDAKNQVVTDAQEAKVAINQILDRVEDLEENAKDTEAKIVALFAIQNNNLNLFVNSYNQKLSELDGNFAAYLANVLSQISSLGTVLDSHVAAYVAQFAILESNYTAHLADITAKMANVQLHVTTYTNEVAAILALMETDYQQVDFDLNAIRTQAGVLVSQFTSDYNSILDALQNDYNIHAPIARNFLINLGQTELARINEQAAANLSVQMQQLVSRGLYTSTIPVDVTQRNARDKDENIQTLNDRLNREKLENQHRLYEQQVAVSARRLDGVERSHSVRQEVLRYQASLVSGIYSLRTELRNRILAGKQVIFAARDANEKYGIEVASNMYAKLQEVRQRVIESLDRIYQIRDVFAKWKTEETNRQYERLQQVEVQFLEGYQRQLAAKQDVVKTEMSERRDLLQSLQSAIAALIAGKEKYAVLLMQNAGALADQKNKAIVQLMEVAVKRLEGWKSVATENTRLMAYQLDERNKLLVGLYAFVERREDVAPEWKDMAQMIAGLGDAGGGWLTPN
jgi:hypothetical protein